MKPYRIAVIAGDGIGTEVVPEGLRVLEAVGARFDISFSFDELDWGCDRFQQTGRFMPEDGMESIKGHDAIFLGAVGFPGVPDHISLWGLLIPLRRVMKQWVTTPLGSMVKIPGSATPYHLVPFGNCGLVIPSALMITAFSSASRVKAIFCQLAKLACTETSSLVTMATL